MRIAKVKSQFMALFVALTAFAALSNCTGNTNEDATSSHDHEGHAREGQASASGADVAEAGEPQFQVDEQFQKQLSAVFTSYVDLHEAFTASDVKKVKQQASETTQALASVDMKLVSGAAHNDWMSYLTPMQTALNQMQSTDDIEAQRRSFSTLSDNLYKSAQAFGLGGKEAFYTYCPMAFNDEGAYWLSDKAKVRNPYFGEKMLVCGEVKEKLK